MPILENEALQEVKERFENVVKLNSLSQEDNEEYKGLVEKFLRNLPSFNSESLVTLELIEEDYLAVPESNKGDVEYDILMIKDLLIL